MISFLLNVLQTLFTPERMKAVFREATEVCLYGEGYGAKIQKGHNYLTDRTDFILFDCKVESWWLTRSNLEDVANKLSVGIVPIMGTGTLLEAVDFVKKGYKSTIAHTKIMRQKD
jgi:hypothetical protein